MSNIKIKLSVDTNDTGQVTALSNYLQALKTLAEAKRPLTAPTPKTKTPVKEMEVVADEVPGKPKASSPTPSEVKSTGAGSKKSPASTPKKSPASTPKPKSSTAEKASSTESAESSTKKEPGSTETSTPKATPKDTGSKDLREPLRELLSEKVGDHREEIKKELAKYDAKNITRLPEEHHEEFMAFMQKLD